MPANKPSLEFQTCGRQVSESRRWNRKDAAGNNVYTFTTITGDVELWIDLEGLLALMARAALRSKGRKSRLAGGLIEARAHVVNITKTEGPL